MSEQQTGTQSQEGGEPQDQASTTPTTTTQGQESAVGDDGSKTTSTDDGKKADTVDPQVKELRGENAATRKKLREAEAKLAELERAQMSDLEKAQADAAKAREEADQAIRSRNNALASSAISNAAVAAKFHAPSDAVDLLASKVEFDADGVPTNVDALVKSLVAERPHLVNLGGPGAGGAPGAATPSGQPENKLSRDDFLAKYGMRR